MLSALKFQETVFMNIFESSLFRIPKISYRISFENSTSISSCSRELSFILDNMQGKISKEIWRK